MKPTHIWNSYRDSRQRGLVILSLSVVAPLHSLNTKCDYDWAVLEIKSADVVLHKHGISATSWITLLYTCAREVQTQSTIACTRRGSQWGPGGRWARAACVHMSQHLPFLAVDLKEHEMIGGNTLDWPQEVYLPGKRNASPKSSSLLSLFRFLDSPLMLPFLFLKKGFSN